MLTVLASCGGSGSDNGNPTPTPPPVSNTPPASAGASVDGFIAFLKTVVPTFPENTETLDVVTFVAPVSDNTEPATGFWTDLSVVPFDGAFGRRFYFIRDRPSTS